MVYVDEDNGQMREVAAVGVEDGVVDRRGRVAYRVQQNTRFDTCADWRTHSFFAFTPPALSSSYHDHDRTNGNLKKRSSLAPIYNKPFKVLVA